MTEFCNDCPMRGEAIGCLTRLYRVDVVDWQNKDGEWINVLGNPIGVMIDEENNLSEPFKLPDDPQDVFNRVERRIAACEHHVSIGKSGWLNKILPWRRNCPAIGHIAVNEILLKSRVKKHISAQVL